MNPFFYRSRLERDLKEWIAAGWVSEGGGRAIMDKLRARAQERYKPFSIALGAGIALILVGMIAFVASNWDGLGYASRLALLFGAMAALYAAALVARERGASSWLAEGFVILAAGMFGANIVLIAQIYNIGADEIAPAIMLWCWGALLAVWGAGSAAALRLVFATLFLYLYFKHPGLSPFIHRAETDLSSLFFLLPWSAVLITAYRWKWEPVLHPAALSFIFFGLTIVPSLRVLEGTEQAAFFTLLFLAIFVWTRAAILDLSARFPDLPQSSWLMEKRHLLERYALTPAILGFTLLYAIASAGEGLSAMTDSGFVALTTMGAIGAAGGAFLLARQGLAGRGLSRRDATGFAALLAGALLQTIAPEIDETPLLFWLHAAYALALALWLIDFGLRGDGFWRIFGYGLFAAQLAHLYVRAFEGLLETSLFLILGGALLLALAYAMRRFHLWAEANAANAAKGAEGAR